MKFEEALTKMREGKKIRHPSFESDVYFQACRIILIGDDTPMHEKPMSIVKMREDLQHEEMGSGSIDNMFYPGSFMIKEKYLQKPCKHGNYPQLNLLLLMADDWELYEN